MDAEARFKIVAFGRQSGKSWLAKRVLLEAAANDGLRCWWVAPTIPTAQDHWDDLVRLINDSGFPTKGQPNNTTKTIRFLSGGSIRIRSADKPDNLRGGTLDFLVLDEAAFMREEVWFKILQPTITASRGRVLFLSTPNGQNWFYRLFRLGQDTDFPDFLSWHMPSTEAPYQDKEMLEVIRRTVPEMVWREEYMAEFLADSGGVFAGLDRVEWREMLTWPEPGHVYVAGIDWGLDEDYTVITIADKYERKQVYGVRFNSIGTTEQLTRIIDILNIWKPEMANIELNGLGYPMFKLLKEQFHAHEAVDDEYDLAAYTVGMRPGQTRLRGVSLNNAKKRKIIERLSAAIEYGQFSPLVRRDENDLESFGAIQMQEMSTFMRQRTASGLEVTYAAAEGYHDDTVMALAFCYSVMDDGPDYDARPEPDAKPARSAGIHRTNKRSPFQTNRPRIRGGEVSRRKRALRG